MTGSQRVRAAFAHVEPDRVPCFEQSIASDVASGLLGREAVCGTTYVHYQEAAAWIAGEEAHAAFEAQLYRDIIATYRALDLDAIHVPWRNATRPTAQVGDYDFLYGDPDGDYHVCRFDPGAKTFAVLRSHQVHPLTDPDQLEPVVEDIERRAAEAVPQPIPADSWHLRFRRDCPDLEVFAPGGLSIGVAPIWLMACALRPDLVARMLDAQVKLRLAEAASWAAEGFLVIWGGGDMADNHGPMYAPRVFRELVLPRVQAYCAGLHALGLQYVYRTDGNLWPIADEFFVQSDIDGFGEMDYEAGMRLPELQALYGHRLTFWGDVPCGTLLYHGTPAQVREFVLRRLAQCRGRGGWLLGSSNSILPGTPVENVVALYHAAREG